MCAGIPRTDEDVEWLEILRLLVAEAPSPFRRAISTLTEELAVGTRGRIGQGQELTGTLGCTMTSNPTCGKLPGRFVLTVRCKQDEKISELQQLSEMHREAISLDTPCT